jgi:predicted PurR-regulated permease PerM
MVNVDFAYFFMGIVLAFALQVLYDGLGEYPKVNRKFWVGVTLIGILTFFVAVFLLLNI